MLKKSPNLHVEKVMAQCQDEKVSKNNKLVNSNVVLANNNNNSK